ncbi:RNA polymerase sigma factor [Agrobacterium rosae]
MRRTGERTMSDGHDFHSKLTKLEEPLRRFARRFLGSEDDVNDLVQETFLKALRYSDQFRPGTSLKSWLFTIMRNTFCTAYRKRTREPVMDDDFIQLHSVAEPPQYSQPRYGV